MSEFQVWFWFVFLPGMREILSTLGSAVCVGGLVLAFIWLARLIKSAIKANEKWEGFKAPDFPKKAVTWLIAAWALTAIARPCIPNEKQIAALILVPAVTQSESVKRFSDKTLDALHKKLDAWIQELSGDNKGGKGL